MKEYIAKTGGRYTYNDDLLNLQDLALSMSAMFDGCPNFIISGCRTEGGAVTAGYVWINGKVRYFEGATGVSLPFYIYESNRYETISYVGDVNKHGRCLYNCIGSSALPQTTDEVSGELPGYVEITETYSPRLIDKFIGRYAVLLDSPFPRQRINKEVVLSGVLTAEREIVSKTSLSVVEGGYELRNVVKPGGDAALGLYHNGTVQQELVIGANGSLSYWMGGNKIASLDGESFTASMLKCATLDCGSVKIQDNNLYNYTDPTDDGAVNINQIGYLDGRTRFRALNIYDGKTANPLFSVEGKHGRVTINALAAIKSSGYGLQLINTTYSKTDVLLKNAIEWLDRQGQSLAVAGFADAASLNFTLNNAIGNIILSASGWIDVQGELRIRGVDIADTYLTKEKHTGDLAGKVDKVIGKGLSTEDFTSAYKQKLDSIMRGEVGDGGEGFVTSGDVSDALRSKLTASQNLADIPDKVTGRNNLDVYSRTEGDGRYLRIRNYLSEITSLSASEIEGKGPTEIIELKEMRQKAVRDNIDAEKKGTGALKLDKGANLADLADKARARQNLGVYSTAYIDEIMGGKLGNEEAYTGETFTSSHRTKLDGIKTGRFAGTDDNGVSQSQSEGYALVSAIVKELKKYAPRLLDGYTAGDKSSVATNIGVYSKTEADERFGVVSHSFQDYINYHVKLGKTTSQAQQIMRDKLDAPSKADLDLFVRKDRKLADLSLPTANDKKLACQAIGAAYAAEYQAKLSDTGWLSCGGSNSGTLWARQIGNIVCIQGTINTANRVGDHWGGILATIPNQISPPRFACRHLTLNIHDDDRRNKGCSFVIPGSSRSIHLYESGYYNKVVELNFSYMT